MPIIASPFPPFTAAERASAARLGEVYSYVRSSRGLPLREWALPSSLKSGLLHAALGSVYGTDSERARAGQRYRNRYELYQTDFLSVIPELTKPALAWAQASLDAEDAKLETFSALLQAADVADELAAAATRIFATVRPFGKPDPSGLKDIAGEQFAPLVDAESWRQLTIAVQEENNPVLTVLFLHPDCLWILRAYAESAKAGTRLATSYVRDARDAVTRFRASISAPDQPLNVWRYPLLVFGGVALRGAQGIPGFGQFASSIGPAYSRNRHEVALGDAQFILLGLGLAFAGLEMLAAAAVVSAAELFLALAQATFAYMREREQDLGAKASALQPDGRRYAAASGYEETLLFAAAAILAGIAMFGGTKAFLEAAKMRRLARLDELEMLTASKNQVKSPRGSLDPSARGTAGSDPNASRATGGGPGGRATIDETARVAGQPVAQAQPAQPPPLPKARATAKPKAPTQEKMTSQPPARPTEEPAPSSAPKQEERVTERPTGPHGGQEEAAARQAERPRKPPPRRDLPPYPENQYQGEGFGGSARVREIPVGGSAEATIAHEGRLRLMRSRAIDYKENIAVVRYKNPRTQQIETAWTKSNGDQHAERALEDWLRGEYGADYDPGMIEKLYTERIPCGAEAKNCYGWMRSELYNAEIEYSFAAHTIPAKSRGAKPVTIDANQELMRFYMRNFDQRGNRIFSEMDDTPDLSGR